MDPTNQRKANIAARLILQGYTVAKAADVVDVSERTIYNWKQQDWWADCLRDAKEEATALGLLDNAYRVINQALDDGDTKTAIWVAETFDERLNPSIAKEDEKYAFDFRSAKEEGPVDVDALKKARDKLQ